MFRHFVVLVWLSLIMLGCTPKQQESVSGGIVYGLTLEPSGIDPHRNQSSEMGIVLRQVYDTLVYRHPETYEIVPGLASAWTMSDDGLVYTFTLRQDVKFHDGTLFNAPAVAANLDRITDPETLSQKAVFLLGPYAGNEVVDTYTIRIFLSQPYSPLLDSLSQIYLGIASPTALQQYSLNRYQYHQVGTGPYQFVEYIPGDRIVLRVNPDYVWGPSFYTDTTEATPQQITYQFFSDPSTRTTALESGAANIMGELLPTDARALSGNSQIRLYPVNIPGQPMQFLINTQRYPTDNLVVRQALIYATNRNAIADTVFQGFSPVAWGPLAANTLYYDPSVVGQFDYDLQQAQALMSSIGFVDADNNGYLDAGEGDLEVVIIVPPWNLTPQVAQLIQDQWRAVGIKAVLQQVPGFAALLESVATGEYNLVAFNTVGYDPVILNQFFMTDAPNNYLGYSNPELDNALNTAMKESSSVARRALYSQIQQFIMDQALILPIRDYVNLNATTGNVAGLAFDPYGWFPLLNNVTVVGS